MSAKLASEVRRNGVAARTSTLRCAYRHQSRGRGVRGWWKTDVPFREALLRRLTLAPALLAATFVLAAPANAQVMERGTVSSAQRADVADYWTPDRMRDAKPAARIIQA